MKYFAQINLAGDCIGAIGSLSDGVELSLSTEDYLVEIPASEMWTTVGRVVIAGVLQDKPVPPPPPAPPQPEPTPAPAVRTLTKLQYMGRFTDAELVGIYTAAKTVVQVEIWLEKFKLASEINLDDVATIGGLQAMEAGGLIGVGRAAEILA